MDFKAIEKLTSEKFWKSKANLNRSKIQRVFESYGKKFEQASISTSFLNGKFVSVNFYIKDEVLENYIEFKFRFNPINPRESLTFKTEVESLPEIMITYNDANYKSYETYNKALKKDITNKIKALKERLTKLENML